MTTRRAPLRSGGKRNEALQELGEMAEQGDFDALLNKAHYRR